MAIDPTSRREIEGLNHLLKERERDHNKEVEEMRDGFREKVNDLKEDQQETIAGIRQKAQDDTDKIRRNFDEQIDHNTDVFERQLTEERNQSYDRLGRSTRDQQRRLEQERETAARQLAEYVNSNNRMADIERSQREEAAEATRRAFEKDRRQMQRYVDEKLTEQKNMASKQLAETTAHARNQVDRNTRYLSDLMERDKLGAELKYRKLAQDSAAEKDHLARAFKQREKQLVDEKNMLAESIGEDGEKDVKDYRDRADAALSRVSADNHFLNALKDRKHADQLAQTEQQHQRQLQDMRAQFNQAENVREARAEAEKSKNDSASSINDRRKKQEEFLRHEQLRNSSNLAQENLKSSYSSALQDAQEKFQKQMLEQSNELKKLGATQQMKNLADRAQMKQEVAGQLSEAELRHTREKQNLVKSYQDSQQAMNELRKRQVEDTKNSLGKEVLQSKEEARREIAKNSIENATRLYLMRQALENRTRELEANRHQALEHASSTYENRVKRVTDNYHRALMQQQDNFDETTAALRHETTLQVAKVAGDAEHEKRLLQLDLQNKNRMLMTAFESRLNQVKDEHAAEMDKLKSDNDKALRDVLKKTKETLDRERSLHARALETKELQMKDRLRLQEEQFKAEIEKLKRTNELALKKS